jgi:hypothetical protein
MPGMWHPEPSDENIRRFYDRWSNVMKANSWDDLRVESVK